MRAVWRLAISNLSSRRSHYALLVGAVTLSAALIMGVAAALNSLNASVHARTEATLGVADLLVQPTGAGQTFDESLVERIRGWQEVSMAVGRLDAALPAVAIRKRVLMPDGGRWVSVERSFQTSAMGNGIVPELEQRVRPQRLLAGRRATGEGEVVVDALLLERLGWAWQSRPDRQYGFGVATRKTVRDRLRPLEMPESVASEGEATRLNERQGARLGDDVVIMPRFVSVGGPVQLLEVFLGPNRIGAMVRFFGGAEGLVNTARFAFSRESRRAQLEFFRHPARLRIVGIAQQPPLGGRPQCYLELGTLQALTDQAGQVSQVDIVLLGGYDPQLVAQAH